MAKNTIKKYFWDTNFERLDLNKDQVYILKRILEYGDGKAVAWAWKKFGKKYWVEALESREISPLTKNFWTSLVALKNK
ncbi:MAG: hypothetical protein D4Q79_00475 [Spirochaetia bacterium]|nr:MAG: hypothetical protein D4Q79_00475 [Spirochaetia bacterium]